MKMYEVPTVDAVVDMLRNLTAVKNHVVHIFLTHRERVEHKVSDKALVVPDMRQDTTTRASPNRAVRAQI